MFAKATYLGYYPLGGDLEFDNIKIMQLDWKRLRRPFVWAFGKSIQGANPTFAYTFVAEENGKSVFFVANEYETGKYHIWSFSDKATKKLRDYKKIKTD